MNTFFQIAIGVIPSIIALVIFSVIKRKDILGKDKKTILKISFGYLATIAVLCVCLVFGFKSIQEREKILGEDYYIQMVYTIAQDGDEASLDIARKIIDEEYEKSVYSEDMLLCNARLSALEGNVDRAYYLYKKLDSKDYSDEFKEVEDAYSKYKNGESGDSFSFTSIQNAIKEFMAEDNSVSAELSSIIVESEKIQTSQDKDFNKLKELVDRINALEEESPDVKKIERLQECKLNNLVLLGQYGEIAKNVDSNSMFETVLVASELHINGFIDDSDYSEEYGLEFISKTEEVSRYLNKLLENDKLTEIDKEKINRTLENYSIMKEYKSLGHNIIMLSQEANDADSIYRSKAFYELSRIHYYFGNSEFSETYFDEAIKSIDSCDDLNFSQPVYNLLNVLHGNGDAEALKNINTYVTQINSGLTSTIDVSDLTSRGIKQRSHDSSDEEQQEDEESMTDLSFEGVNSQDSSSVGDVELTLGNLDSGNVSEPNVLNVAETEDTEETQADSFISYYSDYVIMKNGSMNINGIDISNFKDMKVTFNIDEKYEDLSPEELKKILWVTDCGFEIKDFELSKKNYDKVNVVLCCDVSGSMSGEKIEDLRESVKKFIETSSSVENIALVPFTSGVEEDKASTLGTDKSQLLSDASGFEASGGTNIYDAVEYSLNLFESNSSSLNILMVLSDGQDGSRTEEEIKENIGDLALQKNAIIFGLGLGQDVDGNYLSLFSEAGQGEYFYVDKSETLSNFYSNIRQQVKNQYEISFTAEDTLTLSDRELTIEIRDDNLCTDTKYYDLNGKNPENVNPNLTISGLDNNVLLNPKKDTTVKLLGSGFKKDYKISLVLSGNSRVTLDNIKYVDETTYEIVIPKSIDYDCYDLIVTINGNKKILEKELIVSDGKTTTTKFGDYEFTSYFKYQDKEKTELYGCVLMNDWLNFENKLVIYGDLNSESVTLSAEGNQIVNYDDLKDASKFTEFLVANKKSISIPKFENMTIYNDLLNNISDESGDYKVDKVPLDQVVKIPSLMNLLSPTVALYPDRYELTIQGIASQVPFQEQFIKTVKKLNGTEKDEGITKVNFDGSLEIGKNKIDFKVDIEVGVQNDLTSVGKTNDVGFGNMLNLGLKEGSGKVSIDSEKGVFELGLTVEAMKELKISKAEFSGITLDIGFGIADDTCEVNFNKLGIELEGSFKFNIKGVPCEVEKIGIEADGMKDGINKCTVKGGFTLNYGSFEDTLGKLAKYFPKDSDGKLPSIITFDDASLSCNLKDINIEAKTKIKALGADIGEVSVKLGKFEYENKFIGIDDDNTIGLLVEANNLGLNIKEPEKNPKLTLVANADLQASITNRFIGLQIGGDLKISINLWWFFNVNFGEAHGDVAIGVAPEGMVDYGDTVFFIKASNGKSSHFLYLSLTGDMGYKEGVLT